MMMNRHARQSCLFLIVMIILINRPDAARLILRAAASTPTPTPASDDEPSIAVLNVSDFALDSYSPITAQNAGNLMMVAQTRGNADFIAWAHDNNQVVNSWLNAVLLIQRGKQAVFSPLQTHDNNVGWVLELIGNTVIFNADVSLAGMSANYFSKSYQGAVVALWDTTTGKLNTVIKPVTAAKGEIIILAQRFSSSNLLAIELQRVENVQPLALNSLFLEIWDLSKVKSMHNIATYPLGTAQLGSYLSMDFNEKLQAIAVWNGNDQIELRSVSTGKVITRFPLAEAPLAMQFSADGSTLAAATVTIFYVYDVKSGSIRLTLPLTESIEAFGINTDGSVVVVPEGGKKPVGLWNTHTGQLLTKLPIQHEIGIVQFSPMSNMLLITTTRDSVSYLERWIVDSKK